ncbi:DUF2891 domain-containing protein [Pseudomonas sp.]|uniref:DUF2891 domain-containing protein n=1 Tax=Pseudomonas sp. TaxID=306 RepID=UPI002729DE82|nr:DUF2891 domain-containing protein [Pseudomonas sp.]
MNHPLTPYERSLIARITLGHVTREYPNSVALRLDSVADLAPPRTLHPVFYGSYDWHSCVHGYWLLSRLLGCFGDDLPEAEAIVGLFDEQLTAANVAVELDYFRRPGRGGFERPYGWAWLLKLSTELALQTQPRAVRWSQNLQPLVEWVVARFSAYLPRLSHPVRSGVHSNTAFAMLLALEFAETRQMRDFAEQLRASALDFYGRDRNYQAWEPGGEDFLSPGLQEALLMQRVLDAEDFREWFDAFLPDLALGRPATLLQPVHSRDRTDGRLAHLDGLNLSRAWCLRQLGGSLAAIDPRRSLLELAAQRHLDAGRGHLQDDYMGEHWLASFLVLAVEAGQGRGVNAA